MFMEVVADFQWGYDVVGALHYQRWYFDLLKIMAVVREERYLCKPPCDNGVCGAKVFCKLLRQLRLFRIFHNNRPEKVCPTYVVIFHGMQEVVYVLFFEPSDIAGVVNVSGGGAYEDELVEEIGSF